jgi:hypothetical protein
VLSVDSTLISVLSVPATGLLAFLGTMYRDYRKDKREERQRKWDREDRQETRDLARELKSHADQVVRVTDAQTGQLLAAVEDGNQKTNVALDTANGFNGKIAALHGRMDLFEEILRKIEAKLP